MGGESELSKELRCGAPQGGSLSPALLNIFIDSLENSLESTQVDPTDKAVTLWADDVLVTVGHCAAVKLSKPGLISALSGRSATE